VIGGATEGCDVAGGVITLVAPGPESPCPACGDVGLPLPLDSCVVGAEHGPLQPVGLSTGWVAGPGSPPTGVVPWPLTWSGTDGLFIGPADGSLDTIHVPFSGEGCVPAEQPDGGGGLHVPLAWQPEGGGWLPQLEPLVQPVGGLECPGGGCVPQLGLPLVQPPGGVV